jgi:hypothetical protein
MPDLLPGMELIRNQTSTRFRLVVLPVLKQYFPVVSTLPFTFGQVISLMQRTFSILMRHCLEK